MQHDVVERPLVPSDRKDASVEILVKGLPPGVTEFQLAQHFGQTAPVLKVRLLSTTAGDPLRSAYLEYASREDAQRAAQSCRSLNGFPLTVDIPERHGYMCLPPAQRPLKYPIQFSEHSNDWLSAILSRLEDHPDSKARVAAALNGYMDDISGLTIGQPMSDDEEMSEKQSDALLKPEMRAYLIPYPNCRSLMVKIRSILNNDNKTPISVLTEYAKKTQLNLDFETPADLNVGPYHVTCKLSCRDRTLLYALGHGEASTKKEARQIASAAAIEQLLKNVKEAEFMSSNRARGYGGYARHGRYRSSPNHYPVAQERCERDASDNYQYPGW